MSTRIKGKSLIFTIDSVEYMADVTEVTLENEEADAGVTTFADAAAGGAVQWFISATAISSTDPTSLWRFLWDSTGDEVAYKIAPHGNAVATAAQPHFTGSVTIGSKPSMPIVAGEESTFEFRLDCTGEPTLDEGV